jgi:hypothetical protein
MKSKTVKIIDTESTIVFLNSKGENQMEECWPKGTKSQLRGISSGDTVCCMLTMINNNVLCIWKLLRMNFTFPPLKR